MRNGGGGFAASIYEAMPEGLRRWVSLVSSAFPSRGRCPIGADRAQAAGKTDAESGTARHMWKKRKSLAANDKDFSLCSK